MSRLKGRRPCWALFAVGVVTTWHETKKEGISVYQSFFLLKNVTTEYYIITTTREKCI